MRLNTLLAAAAIAALTARAAVAQDIGRPQRFGHLRRPAGERRSERADG